MCVYSCTCCVCSCVCLCIYSCVCSYVCVFRSVPVYLFMCVAVWVHVCGCVCSYVCLCIAHVYVCVCVCSYECAHEEARHGASSPVIVLSLINILIFGTGALPAPGAHWCRLAGQPGVLLSLPYQCWFTGVYNPYVTFLKWMLDGRTRILMLGQQSLCQMTHLPCYWKEAWEEPTVKGWSVQQIFLGLFEGSLVTRAGETLPVLRPSQILYFAQPRMQGHHFIKSHGVWGPGCRSLGTRAQPN